MPIKYWVFTSQWCIIGTESLCVTHASNNYNACFDQHAAIRATTIIAGKQKHQNKMRWIRLGHSCM